MLGLFFPSMVNFAENIHKFAGRFRCRNSLSICCRLSGGAACFVSGEVRKYKYHKFNNEGKSGNLAEPVKSAEIIGISEQEKTFVTY
jgi:hypothetical protein